MKRSTALKILSLAPATPALLASNAGNTAAAPSSVRKASAAPPALDSRARNGNPPVVTVTPWGQHIQYDPATYIALQKYTGLKKGQRWEDGDSIERELQTQIQSGALVIERPPTRLLEGVWALGGDGQQRIYLIDTGAGLLLVDPSYEPLDPGIQKQVKDLGYALAEVKWVLFTHCHVDHTQSGHIWQKRGAKLFIHSADLHPLRTASDITAWWLLPDPVRFLTPPSGPIETFEDADDLKFGGLTLRVIHTPGHTPGSCCFFFQREGKNVLLGEDIVLHFGRHAWMGNPYADWEQYLKSLWKVKRFFLPAGKSAQVGKRMAAVEYDLLLPGHGAISLDCGTREVDYTIQVVSEVMNRRSRGEDIDWLDPYPFFRDREEKSLGPIQVQYR
jgi:hydroxyacylglutathione hydrolase